MDAHAMTDTTVSTRILAPLDGSPLSESALPMAAFMARRTGGSLHLTRVHVPVIAAAAIGFPVPDWENEIKASESTYLRTVAKRLQPEQGVEAETTLLEGSVPRAIADHARELGASLIVITTHGRTGLSRAWLGSTADWLTRYAPCPVLLVRAVEGYVRGLQPALRHVLVPLDGSQRAEKVVPHAARIAQSAGARLTLVRVVSPVFRGPTPFRGPAFPLITDEASTADALQRARDYLVDAVARIRREHDLLEVHTEAVASERVADALVEWARAGAVDMIAMSTRGRGASRLLVGSVADKVLRGFTGTMLLLGPVAGKEMDTEALSHAEEELAGA